MGVKFRKLPLRHGALPAEVDARSEKQRRQLRTRQLQMGDRKGTENEPEAKNIPNREGMMPNSSARFIAVKVDSESPLLRATFVVTYRMDSGCPKEIRFMKCRWPLDNIPDGEWCEILDAIKKCEKE